MSFNIINVVPSGLAVVRVTYSSPPRALSPTGAFDALNPTNYVFSGSNITYASSISPVVGNPSAFDCFLVAPLQRGAWKLHAINVVDETGSVTVLITDFNFNVNSATVQTSLAGGAINDAEENILRRHLNPALKGPGWDSLIAALSTGHRMNSENAKLAFNQLQLTSASGRYLDRRAGELGIKRPANLIISDELFRQLAVVEHTRQLTQEAILEVLEVFYSIDAVRASMTSVDGPFNLKDGDQLEIVLDEQDDIIVTFSLLDFASISQAQAAEVAAAITRAIRSSDSQGFAVPFLNTVTQKQAVKIYSGSRGLSSSVQIVGGNSQNVLLFPTPLFTTSGGSPFAVWDITLSTTTPGNVRFTETSGIFNLSLVHGGDLAYIYGSEFSASGNVGVFEIQNVEYFYSGITLIQRFEITNPAGTAQAGVNQTLFPDLAFFRPKRNTIYDGTRSVVVAQTTEGVNIVIPATTTQAVSRKPGQAAYGQQAPTQNIDTLTEVGSTVTVTTLTNHGLTAGQHVLIDGVQSAGTRPATTVGTPSPDFAANVVTGVSDASLLSIASQAGTFQAMDHQVVRLPEGFLLALGGRIAAATIANPVLFEVLSTAILGDGSRQETYKWTNLNTLVYTGGRRDFGSCTLADGRVLKTGGTNSVDDTGVPVSTNGWDLFTYTRVPSVISEVSGTMPAAVAGHAQCAPIPNFAFDAMICGGWYASVAVPSNLTYAFNATTLTWIARANLNVARRDHAVVHQHDALPSGAFHFLAIGGLIGAGVPFNGCEIGSSNLLQWTVTGAMTYARYRFGTIVLPDTRVLVVGGIGFNPTQSTTPANLSSCEVYEHATQTWSPLPPMKVARVNPIVTLSSSGDSVTVSGGGSTMIEILSLKTMIWSLSAATLATALNFSAGGIASTDTLVVMGGIDNSLNTQKKNYVVVPGKDTFRVGRFNKEERVATVPSSTSFTVEDPTRTGYTTALAGATFIPETAPAASPGVLGPFIFDPKNGLAVTSVVTTLTTVLSAGQTYQTVELASTAGFPDSIGYLVFDFGETKGVGPVKYLGVNSSVELSIDAGFMFPNDVPAGVTVTLLSGRAPFQPPRSKQPGNFYVTGSAAGRVAAETAIDETVAAGMNITTTVVYPGDRGLGNAGRPTSGTSKISDIVEVFGGDSLDVEVANHRTEE